ncbi:MAG: alpha/beta hydrolase [Synergistaceae bacterium]|nr:alpha/beta hydrolase [Synergistaceae bacterium]
MKKIGRITLFALLALFVAGAAQAAFAESSQSQIKKAKLKLTAEWDKTFPQSEKVAHSKVTFVNRFGITLAADMYVPKGAKSGLPAIAICGPFGAVKEQSSGLYAQKLAELGYLTIAFDPSFTGESGGTPRNVSAPDINTEDFQAAVDFLCDNKLVDKNRIGILGICGWGGIALNAAAIDTRVKATVASTMYDMTRVNSRGYFDSLDEEGRYAAREAMNAQRVEDYKNGSYKRAGGVVDPLPEDAPFFVKDYYSYYKTSRGYHPRSLNSNEGWNATSGLSWMNARFLQFSNEIRSAVLVIHGEKAHSCYFSRDAYENMTKDSKYAGNKQLVIIPGAVHTDLYDKLDVIPFARIDEFYKENLKK